MLDQSPALCQNEQNILIVDDSPFQQNSLQTIIQENFNFQNFQTASNGKEALAKYENLARQKKLFDIIFMDIQMPVMDGLVATKELRNIEKERMWTRTYICGISMGVFTNAGEQALQSGMDNFIEKPASSKSLKELFEVVPSLKHLV